MSDKDPIHEIDGILSEVREHLGYTQEQGEIYELRALQLLLQVTKAMHSQTDPHKLITLILDSALSFAEADRAFLMMIGEDQRPRFKMGRSYDGVYLDESQFQISTSVVQEVLSTLQPVIVADAFTNEDFKSSQSIRDLQLRTIMSAPLEYQDRVLGLIYVDSKRPMARYSKHHVNVIASLAGQAAVALQNIQKFETFEGDVVDALDEIDQEDV